MAKRMSKTRLPGDTEETQVRMGFGEHLEELRKRLIYSIVGSIGFVVVCLYYSRDIVFYLVRPYLLALKAHGYPTIFSFDKPPSVVINYLSIGVKAGLILASPWIIYQIWLFVAAGLYQKERRIIYRYITPSALLFLLGIAFFYFLVLPLTLNFFIGFTDHTAIKPPQATWLEQQLGLDSVPKGVSTTQPATQQNMPPLQIPVVTSDPPKPPDGYGYLYFNLTDGVMKFRVGDQISVLMVAQDGSLFSNVPQFDEYIDFLTFMSLIFGLAFEMPMVILILAQIGLVTPATFRKIRKYAYFAIAIISCVAAPSTDPLTMMCLMVPLIALYEAGVVAASIAVRKKAATVAEE
jgi:sec-independent protein translocase protein TatC